MWIAASIPFWILGGLCLLGAIGSVKWGQPTTDKEARAVFGSLVFSGIFLVIAALVAR